MKNRFMMLWMFLFAFTFSAPALAVAPSESDTGSDAPITDVAVDDTGDTGETGETGEDVGTTGEEESDAPAATGPVEIETDEDAVEAAKGLYDALQSKEWSLALGLGLALLVFLLRKVNILAKVPSKALPWVTAGLGIVGYVVAALMTEGASLVGALTGGFMSGAVAVGLWEMVLKGFLSVSAEEASEEPASEEEENDEDEGDDSEDEKSE